MKKIKLSEVIKFVNAIEGTPIHDWMKTLVDPELIFAYFSATVNTDASKTKIAIFNEIMDHQVAIFDRQMWNNYDAFSRGWTRYESNLKKRDKITLHSTNVE